MRKPMSVPAMVMAGLILPAMLFSAASGQRTPPSPPSDSGPKFIGQTVGETKAVVGQAGTYERLLLAPPDEDKLSPGTAWEITADLAVKLGRMESRERWRVIRRNLGLSPDDGADFILWKEVADTILSQIGTLPLEKESLAPTFGLRVAFPGLDKADIAKADVAITFNSDELSAGTKKTGEMAAGSDFESRLNQKVADSLTGVEGFLSVVAAEGPPMSSERTAKIYKKAKLRLFDDSGHTFTAVPDSHGYFLFAPIPAVPEFGADYRLQVTFAEESPSAEAEPVPTNAEHYVPVRQGLRTRLNIPVAGLKSRGVDDASGLPGAPAAISLLFQKFVAKHFLLGAVMERLPANPGLHLGAVYIEERGYEPFYSVRFHLKSPGFDRRPLFLSRGAMRLQCTTSAASVGIFRTHFVKILWTARADAAQLELKSRRTTESPWGLGVGIVPSLSPALYAGGLSYEPIPYLELFAGAGIRKGFASSFVFGATVDVEAILTGLFGNAPKTERTGVGPSLESLGQEEAKAEARTEPPPVPARDKKK